jgi:hypothetical protein
MKTVLACLVLSVGLGWSQGSDDQTAFDHKSASSGVPFVWPSTWGDVSSVAISREEVLRFLTALDRDDPPDAIQSFRFVPLEKDKFYLVADTDASGNDLFGTLEIVRCEGAACIVCTQLTEAEDLDTDIVDMNGDGVFEVVTKQSADYHTRSDWGRPPFVYSIRSVMNGKLVDISSKYPDYFKSHIFPRMEADRKAIEVMIANMDKPQPLHLSDLEGNKRVSADEEQNNRQAALANDRWKLKATVELQYVQDDYRRRILGEKTAGLENALKWVRSDDQGLREFGVKALEPIDSPTAAAELLRIANSKDSELAENARNALNRRVQARLAPPPPGGAVK